MSRILAWVLCLMVAASLLTACEWSSGPHRGPSVEPLNVTVICDKKCELEFAAHGDALVSKRSILRSNCSLHVTGDGVRVQCPQNTTRRERQRPVTSPQ